MLSKKDLRQKIKTQRQLLTPSQIYQASIGVWLQLIRQPYFDQAVRIGFYMPVRGELDTNPVLKTALKLGKKTYFPVLQPDQVTLSFYRYSTAQKLIPNQFGILEPQAIAERRIANEKLDLVLVPLVAFDEHCNRLGMGKGYYDRTFAAHRQSQKPLLVGLAYEFQKITRLPTMDHDIPLDAVITSKKIYLPQPKQK